MAQLRVRIVNFDDLEKKLPKLKRSLSVQENVDLVEDPNEEGVFLLVINQQISINNLKNIRKLLDAYGFAFYYQDYVPPPPKNWEQGCECEACKVAQDFWKKLVDEIKESQKKELEKQNQRQTLEEKIRAATARKKRKKKK